MKSVSLMYAPCHPESGEFLLKIFISNTPMIRGLETTEPRSSKSGLTHSHTMIFLTPLGNKPFENNVGKGEIARNEQFLLFPQCFLPIWIIFY